MSDFDQALGAWMAGQRESTEISQESVAIQMGLDQPALSKIERGRRRVSVSELLHWAESVGVTDTELHQALIKLRAEHFGFQRRVRSK